MEDDDEKARAIYQDLLDKINDAIRVNDFALFATYFELPHTLEIFEGRQVIEDEAALHTIFSGMVHNLTTLNVEGLSRFCSSARFVDDQTIHGCHETRMINRDYTIVNAYPALSTLRLTRGKWRVKDSQYASENVAVSLNVGPNKDPS